ncbi:MAG: exodeoxyribonuclease VII small subunit [Candidatus Muiribacteriota bacterium]
MAKKKEENFEHALKELEKIAEEFEKGEIGLDESVEKFRRGTELLKFCETKLNEAEGKISELIENNKIEDLKHE